MKLADNIVELARELGVRRPLLYQWEAAAEGRGRGRKKKGGGQQPNRSVSNSGTREAALSEEVRWLREALAKKVKEADFFRGALQRVEVLRQSSGGYGGTGST